MSTIWTMVKQAIRRNLAIKSAIGVLGALVLWIIATAHGSNPRLFPGPPGVARTTLYLIDNGFHTDLAIPRAALAPGPTQLAATAATNQPWVAIGWGDEKFYTQSGFSGARVTDAARALFMPDNPSVVHIEGLPRAPDKIYAASNVRPVIITNAGFQALTARIDRSFALGPDGRPVRGPPGDGPDAAFYRSVEHFSIVHVCNHWTASLLHAAGLPTTPVIDTIPAGLKLDLKLRAGE